MANSPDFILLVEDNADDVFLMSRAWKRTGLGLPMHIVGDGQEALDYLQGAEKFQDRNHFPLPALIFLDLKLPFIHGFEILEWLRRQPLLKNTPVIVLTSSPEDRDRQKATELGALAYLVKPPQVDTVLQYIKAVDGRLCLNHAGQT